MGSLRLAAFVLWLGTLTLPVSAQSPSAVPSVVGFWKGTSTHDDQNLGSSAFYFRITQQTGTRLEYVSVGTGSGSVSAKGDVYLRLGNTTYGDEIAGHVDGNEMKGRWTTYSGSVASHGTFIVHRQ
jgi:hypothetical protein